MLSRLSLCPLISYFLDEALLQWVGEEGQLLEELFALIHL